MTKKTKLQFGGRVRLHREKALCLTIREAAAATGISPATMSQVENCKTPDVFTFAKLCRWMGFCAEQALIDLGA
jgi:transcriptional regulator with XRE-family HTH domain